MIVIMDGLPQEKITTTEKWPGSVFHYKHLTSLFLKIYRETWYDSRCDILKDRIRPSNSTVLYVSVIDLFLKKCIKTINSTSSIFIFDSPTFIPNATTMIKLWPRNTYDYKKYSNCSNHLKSNIRLWEQCFCNTDPVTRVLFIFDIKIEVFWYLEAFYIW